MSSLSRVSALGLGVVKDDLNRLEGPAIGVFGKDDCVNAVDGSDPIANCDVSVSNGPSCSNIYSAR